MIDVIAFAIAALSQQIDVAISVREPRAPQHLSNRLTIECGNRKLEIDGVGFVVPLEIGSTLALDGAPIETSEEFLQYIREPRSSYRASARCSASPSGFQVIIYRASIGPQGSIDYTVRSIDIDARGRFMDRGTEMTDAENFYFR